MLNSAVPFSYINTAAMYQYVPWNFRIQSKAEVLKEKSGNPVHHTVPCHLALGPCIYLEKN
jgi:hypothetical protein